MLEVYAYNTGKGDCIRIKFAESHNLFIDTGRTRFGPVFKRLCNEIEVSGESLDVLILTHVDNDHIGGILFNLRNGHKCPFKEVWMNHEGIGVVGDTLLSTRENNEVYNRLTQQGVIVRPMVMGDKRFIAGAVIAALNPERREIPNRWRDATLARHDDYGVSLSELATRPITKRDTSSNNKKSIICSFEYGGRKLLFTGDVWAEDIVKASGNFDLVKLPHHGSVRNISEEYKNHIKAKNFLICTDHPDKQTIAKLEDWYGKINIYSPIAWWQKNYFVQGDREHKIDYFQKEGFVIAW